MKIFKILPFLFLIIASTLFATEPQYLSVKPASGEGAYALLKKYRLAPVGCNLKVFKEINKLGDDLVLVQGKSYKLPIFVYQYNATSIRSTIGRNDWDLAKAIQLYNEELNKKGIKEKDYRNDNVLWVPYEYLNCFEGGKKETVEKKEKLYPIFGGKYQKIDVKDKKLANCVYYIIGGHGGPDPGAQGKYKGHTLSEDEYAYDIALRLARDLLEHSAIVHVIVRDPNDGIRDGMILKSDKDEVCWKNQKIPLNQVKRLNQRSYAVNDLYAKYKKQKVKKQRLIILHVDSRGKGQRLDMFFYHSPKSKTGKKLATTLRNTIEAKYAQHQKSRGYSGTVESRNLHVLRKTHPVAVFIELGNIRNPQDQKRFVIEDNRQAVANWLTEGLLKEN
ncbi:MAG: N-acetylmuramoyl-L-alanine amidase [Chlorobi bacterium]|nr:N-acetylmuramoyl-L-alanine amidase [Chlorobiota bacterium]